MICGGCYSEPQRVIVRAVTFKLATKGGATIPQAVRKRV